MWWGEGVDGFCVWDSCVWDSSLPGMLLLLQQVEKWSLFSSLQCQENDALHSKYTANCCLTSVVPQCLSFIL